MKIKRFGMGSITLLAVAMMSACSSSPASTGTSTSGGESAGLTVGSILYSPDGYQSTHGRMMEDYGAEIGVEIKTCNSNAEVATQLQCVSDMVAAQVDAVIMQPIEPAAATTMVEQLQAANIAVVTWAIGPVPDVTVPFIDLAEYDQAKEAGARAAQWVRENFDEAPMIVDLGVPNNTNCTNRETGFIDGATEADPETVVVAQPNGKGLRLESAAAMADVINSGADFNIVTGCNGESTLGGLQALREAGRGQAENKVPVSEYMFSVDGTPDEITELIDPSSPLMETLALTPYDNVRGLLDTALKLQAGEIDNTYNEMHLQDAFLPSDCAELNVILDKQYGETVSCPS
ncbi:MAG: sugar ABC transporter substrate-binding protein [Propioniciclava sp.]